MDRTILRIDDSHNRHVCKMAGTTDRDEYLRCFPNPMPATHRLAYQWTDEMTLVIGPEPIPITEQALGPGNPKSPVLPAELKSLSNKELKTKAAELGVNVAGNASRAQLESAIATKVTADQDEKPVDPVS